MSAQKIRGVIMMTSSDIHGDFMRMTDEIWNQDEYMEGFNRFATKTLTPGVQMDAADANIKDATVGIVGSNDA